MSAETKHKTSDLKEALLSGVLSSNTLELPIGQAAKNALSILEFPNSRTEEWKYTRVGKLVKQQFATPSLRRVNIEERLIPGLDADRMVFVNGILDESNSVIPNGDIIVKDLASLKETPSQLGELSLHDTRIFEALNSAFPTNGVLVHIPKGHRSTKPLHVIHIASGTGQLSQPRHLIIAEESSEAEVIFSYHAENAKGCLTNSVLECFVSNNAKLNIDLIQNGESPNFNIHSTHVHQSRDSHFKINTLTLNGKFIRNDLNIRSDGQNCESTLNGAYILNEDQHVDNHTIVDHLSSHCNSSELYKGVISDKATAVFNGKVFVRQDAQKVNAFQSNANILLSDDATINSKPELEIYADDVKCSHGSTTGQLDEEALFYLRSRGIPTDQARELLVKAFVADVLDNIDLEAVREYVGDIIDKKLAH